VTADAVRRNAERIRDRIAGAGGDPDTVQLLPVTKGHDADAVSSAMAAGFGAVGENYAQELLAKSAAMTDQPEWHFIGHLQRNKVRHVAPFVAVWQSIDRLSVGEEVARRAPGAAVLVEVNLTDDPARSGARPNLVPGLVEGLRDLDLRVQGLMAVGPQGPPEDVQAGFRTVRRLADRLVLAERSMGMSDDFELAVAEGATMVRIGTGLFGPRPRLARPVLEN
jgi:pyridoxal phosphate enzyme (YggS family)